MSCIIWDGGSTLDVDHDLADSHLKYMLSIAEDSNYVYCSAHQAYQYSLSAFDEDCGSKLAHATGIKEIVACVCLF